MDILVIVSGVLVIVLLLTNAATAFFVVYYRNKYIVMKRLKSTYFLMYRRKSEESRENRLLRETDSLTGLISADAYHAKIQELLNTPRRREGDQEWTVLLAVIDLNKLKSINDKYGHLCGNRVLKEYARLLDGELFRRPEELVIRSSRRGDEFMVVIPCLVEDVPKVRARLLHAGKVKVMTDNGNVVEVTASIGSALLNGSIEEAIEEADKNMYAAKRRDALHVVSEG